MKLKTKYRANKVLTCIAVVALVVMASLAAMGANKAITDISAKANIQQTEVETEAIYQAPSLYERRLEECLNNILRNQRTLSSQLQRIEQQLNVITARQTGADLPETVEK